MSIRGYKAFRHDMTNQVGFIFEEGKTYTAPLPIKQNYNGNGYHFAKNLEDTLAFVKNEDIEIKIAEVTGSGIICEYELDYYGYYNLYCAEKIKVEKILSREEVLTLIVQQNHQAIERFVKYYKLTTEEIKMFKDKYVSWPNILSAISYYQEKDKEVYNRKYVKKLF